jgi:glycosyltransferase involved in cell wall biosynthesis
LSWLRDIKKVDRIIVVSQFLYDKLVELGVSESQISIVSNSTAVHEVTAPGNFVLYLGNIAGEKGIHTFCEAAAELPFLSFIAAGDGRELLHLKKKYSAIKNLNFKGYADPFTRTKLLSECRFLYFPTRCMETFGMVILEAFSYGKPVLTTGSGATGELVISGKTGEINSSKNFKSQADSVINLWNKLDNNDEYSKNCLETARKYSPANHLRQLEEIYYNL